ncbi:MAG: alpha-ketoacid dehydrogenase subunit beta [Phycisphaerales bacterium]|nr:alpha-ketoacid dehydrogenase subunit beta [Phycisphaerales bacterium]
MADAADKAKSMNLIQSVNAALAYALEHDPKVLVFGEDVADPENGGMMGCTRGLSTRFGNERVRSTPISEQAIIGAAIGAAMGGFKPVAEIMLMNFIAVAMDMIVNHAAKLRFMSGGQTAVPIVIRTTTGAGLRTAGQHADYLEQWFTHTAGIKVIAPSTAADAYGLLLSCIDDPDPCLFIENLASYLIQGAAPIPGQRISLGKAKVTREGADATVISYSRQANEALAAAEALASEGISVEVVDLRTISPWDQETVLNSVRKTGRALVVHEAAKRFGPGGEIASVIQEEVWDWLKAPVMRVGGPSCAVPFSKPLEEAFIVDHVKIAEGIRNLMNRSKK